MTTLRLIVITLALAVVGCNNGTDVPLGGADGAVDVDAAANAADAIFPIVDAMQNDAVPASWTQFTIFDTRMPRDVWGSGPDDVWAVGRFGTLLHWTGGPTWNIVIGPDSSAELMSVWGSASNEVWAVGTLPGQVSTIFRWNGSDWSTDTSAADSELTGVWGLPSGEAWLVGHAFNFYHYVPAPTDDWQQAQGFDVVYWPEDVWVDAAADADMWIVGNQGISRWSNVDTSYKESFTAPNELLGVWGLDADNVWAVGKAGTIMRWNGATWDAQASNTTNDLHAIWASSANDAWAVGAAGTIVHWNGSTWQPFSSGTTLDLFGIWGSSASDVWAVGGVDSGVILRYAPL